MSKGVLYVAYGNAAKSQAAIALNNLGRVHPDWSAAVITDAPFALLRHTPAPQWIEVPEHDAGARWQKLRADMLTPFDKTLYYDADTRVRYSIAALWEPLDDGWELLFAPCASQCRNGFAKHLIRLGGDDGRTERETTLSECGWPLLAMQGGLVGFRKTPAVSAFFAAWRQEWQRWRGQDQGALIRALRRTHVKVLPVSRAYNGGDLVGHYHAHARRRGLRGSIA